LGERGGWVAAGVSTGAKAPLEGTLDAALKAPLFHD